MSEGPDDLYAVPDVYDAQYRSYREDLAFYRRVVEDHGGPVLELGCGTGRVTLEMARTGASVTGVDVAKAMLHRARDRIAAAGPETHAALVLGDMTRLDEAIPREERFMVVAAPFNTLMHAYSLEDQDRVLAGAYARLVPGGTFACDMYVPRFGRMGVVRSEPMWQRALGPDTDLFLVQEHDPAGQRIVSTYLIDRLEADGRLRRRRVELVQRYFTRFEIERAVRSAGFERVRIFGSFERGPFRAESDTIVVLARKPGP